MSNEEDDFFGEDDDDLDAETLLVLEQAEKQHAAISASQLPSVAPNAYRPVNLPVKPLLQANRQPAVPPVLQSSSIRLPAPSQQHRDVSAKPGQQFYPAAGTPPSQYRHPQYAPSQQPNKPYNPNQDGNAAAGPSTSTYVRKVVKPTYRDDFPNVDIDDNAKRYRTRDTSSTAASVSANHRSISHSTVDAEKENLKQQLAELQLSLEKERKERFSKNGEVSYLRQMTEKLAKEHEAAIQEQIRKVLPLQERITTLESRLNQENARHSSAMIFQKQELESKYRNVAASARKRQHVNSKQQSQATGAASQSSPRRNFKTQKGFQNSFNEPMTSTQQGDNGTRLPSSPSDGRAEPMMRIHSSDRRDKGKRREFEPSSEMEYNDLSDYQADAFDPFEPPCYGEAGGGSAQGEGAAGLSVKAYREEITSYLFDHIPRDASCTALSLFSLVNPNFPADTNEDRIRAHRNICQNLFHCFGNRTESTQAGKQHITRFLWDVLKVFLDFVNFFSTEEAHRAEVIVGLNLIQDLCQRYPSLALHADTDAVEYETVMSRVFSAITQCVKNERTRLKSLDTLPTSPASVIAAKSNMAAPPPRSRQARNEAAKARFEREVEDLLCALLYLLQFLALRPDPTRLNQLDAFLRDKSNSLAFFMDTRRRPTVHYQALMLTALLSGEPALFRSLLATSFIDELSSINNAPPAPSTAIRPQQLPFVEQTASFLNYLTADEAQTQGCRQLAITTLSNLAIIHADGTPLLSRSPSLVQRLIMRLAMDTATLYDGTVTLPRHVNIEITIRMITACMRLIFHLVLSQDGLKSLSSHLSERPFARDYFISGIGRIACTEAPDWMESPSLISQLDLLANLGFELLEDVLSPDEVEDLYSLCRDEEQEGKQDEVELQAANGMDEEEEMAAQNIDAMES